MGITSVFEPRDPVTHLVQEPEVDETTIHNVVFYLRTLRPPVPRNEESTEYQAGKVLFSQIGCGNCHTPEWTTLSSDLTYLSNKTFYPYTDLLLHDMGADLDDGVTEGSAETYEWRTPALWGLGLSSKSQGREVFLLHDGRAHSIEEAILLHGGEGSESRNQFKSLSNEEQNQLLFFLESL